MNSFLVRRGRESRHLPHWNAVKYNRMFSLQYDKFDRLHRDNRKSLKNTRLTYLEYRNKKHDQNLGNCVCWYHYFIQGENRLGEMLMELRERIQKEDYVAARKPRKMTVLTNEKVAELVRRAREHANKSPRQLINDLGNLLPQV